MTWLPAAVAWGAALVSVSALATIWLLLRRFMGGPPAAAAAAAACHGEAPQERSRDMAAALAERRRAR